MTVQLNDKFSPTPENASITVAEIKGSEHPDERVIIGGHLDSWDLGQGALDNGTGAMATLEAARTLKALGWKPKRTITFILFTGEEQGGIGADHFVKNHAAEIAKIEGFSSTTPAPAKSSHRPGEPMGDRAANDRDLSAAAGSLRDASPQHALFWLF